MRKHLLSALFALLTAPALAGDPLADGLAAYDSGQFQKAFQLLKPLADADDAVAQLKVGLLYYLGNGVGENETLAIEWLKKSAAKGNQDAMYHLGNAYTFGVETAKMSADADVDAAKWYFEAARAGHKDAQYALGLMFLAGKGVVQSQDEAMKWIRRAAAQGHREAQSFVQGQDPHGKK